MRILVTGKSGQVARALAHVNDPVRHELLFLGRPEFDLDRPASLYAQVKVANPDIIISCAAHTLVDQCESEPDKAWRINADAPGVIAQAAKELGIPIIHLSTDCVFDGEISRPYRETDVARPLNVYGVSKLAGEAAVAAQNPRHAIVRVSWVYSQFSNNFLRAMLNLAASRDEISVVSDQISCPTPGIALAQALIVLAERMASATENRYGVFHLAGQSPVSRTDLARAVMDWAQANGRPAAAIRPVPSSDFPTPARRPLYSALDCQKIQSVYNIALPSWQTWLDECLGAMTVQK